MNYLVRDAMFGPAFRTFDLSSDIIYEAVEAWLHAECVLTWQQLWIAESVQTDGARKKLVELGPSSHFVKSLAV